MEKIAYVVASEDIIKPVEEVLREEVDAGTVVVQTTDVFHPRAEYRRLSAEGYGAIIARGGTYEDFEEIAESIPVIQEKIRTSDILYMLSEVRNYYRGKIYVILREHTAKKFEKTVELFKFPIEVKRYTTPETLKNAINRIPEKNVLVLSSGIAAKLSDREDIQIVRLKNRDTTIKETVVNAQIFLQGAKEAREIEQSLKRNLAKRGLVASYKFKDIITQDKDMKRLIEKAKTVSKFEGSVLIYGENGTGKELFSQSIHNESRRKNGPFVAVNCAALTESLLESELFGYVEGAFTGARKGGKAGLFELAHQGTIFLDEINSMSLSLQAKILRVIEQQEVMRVGSDYVIPLDVRIIAASNSKLENYIDDGSFRKDLYFRLNTFQINIPSMNKRKKDVVLLFKHYLSQFEDVTDEEMNLTPEFEKELFEHSWSGNVREIKSTALRYHAFGGDNSGGNILSNISPKSNLVTDDLHIDLSQLNKVVEGLVIESLAEKNMTKSEIAKSLGISRQALYKKMSKNE